MPAKRISIPEEDIMRILSLGVPYSQIKKTYGLKSTSIITRLIKRVSIEKQKTVLTTATGLCQGNGKVTSLTTPKCKTNVP